MYIDERSQRPKLKLPLSNLEKILFLASILFLFTIWFISIDSYSKLPDIIPTHFNVSSVPDGYGSKNSIFISPVIVTVLYILIMILTRFPHIYNYAVSITAENAEANYRNGRTLMFCIITEILALFLYIQWNVIDGAIKGYSSLGILFLPIFLLTIFGTVIYFIFKMTKLK